MVVLQLAQADLFAMELVGGHLYLHLDLGSGAAKVKGTPRRVDDGTWHEVTLRRSGREGRLTVDDNAADFSTPGITALIHCLYCIHTPFNKRSAIAE